MAGDWMGVPFVDPEDNQYDDLGPRGKANMQLKGLMSSDAPAPENKPSDTGGGNWQANHPTAPAQTPVQGAPSQTLAQTAMSQMPQVPTAPTWNTSQYQQQMASKAQLSTPTPLYQTDAQGKSTGQMLPQYKPKWYTQLARGVAAGAAGWNHQQYNGPSFHDPNVNYETDEAKRQAQLQAVTGQMGDEVQQFGQAQSGFNSQLAGAKEGREQVLTSGRVSELEAKGNKYDNAIDPNSIEEDPANPGQFRGHSYGNPATWMPAATPKAMQQHAAPPPKNYEEAVLRSQTDPDPKMRQAYAAAAKIMQGAEQKKFAAGGPRPDSLITMFGTLKSAWVSEHKRQPNTAELMTIMAGARGGSSGRGGTGNADDVVSSLVASSIAKKEAFANSLQRNEDDGSYKDAHDRTISAKEFQAKIDQFRTDLNVKLAKHGQQQNEQGEIVPTGGQAQVGPPQSAAATGRSPWAKPPK